VQNSTLDIHKAVSAFERVMTGRVMHGIAFLSLCAAYIQGGVSKLSSIFTSLAETERSHLPAGPYLTAVITTALTVSAMVSPIKADGSVRCSSPGLPSVQPKPQHDADRATSKIERATVVPIRNWRVSWQKY
jgi:hypothetical protein